VEGAITQGWTPALNALDPAYPGRLPASLQPHDGVIPLAHQGLEGRLEQESLGGVKFLITASRIV
jgi:hypothetical protein